LHEGSPRAPPPLRPATHRIRDSSGDEHVPSGISAARSIGQTASPRCVRPDGQRCRNSFDRFDRATEARELCSRRVLFARSPAVRIRAAAVDPILAIALAALILGASMLALLNAGRIIGVRRLRADPKGAAGAGAVNAAVLSLLGLFLAFGYSDASKRFDERRRLVVEETNDIGTAWLRVAMLPTAAQPAMRASLRQYLDARIGYYDAVPDTPTALDAYARVERAQTEMWSLATAACSQPDGERARLLLLPALNAMFDITTTRLAMQDMHPPVLVFIVFIVLALASALLAGISMAAAKSRSWIHMIGFATLISTTLYLIAEIEFPRHGLVRNDSFDRLLVDLRQKME
jgi:hypothetical protein